ncbi:ABC transporter substrate-binding protein [Sediminispirochaeta bajacaliforniensis]|uniref:ABC transporter substrate-binding protein n=1 Tax=Sediminispirochaeta bajacaliforniensis TaxID=148 RepID=UPI000382F16B|nr:ABC transporter substrate-binding protein [Sediminispirochaeta bajacaliforniensis]
MKNCLVMVLCIFLSLGTLFANGTQESETQKKTKIRFAVKSVGKDYELMKEASETYESLHPDIDIELVETPESSTDRLGLYLQYFEAKSSELDAVLIDVVWPGELNEHLIDLNEYGAASYTSQHFPTMVQNNTVHGKLLAMPLYTDAGVLYYRTDLLKKYGFTLPPKTWNELEHIAQVVQSGERAAGNEDFWGFVWQGNAYEGLTCNALEWIYSHGGGTIMDKDGTVTIDNPKAAAGLDMAANWVGTISPSGITGFVEEDARSAFQAGNAMFMRNWPYCYSLGQSDSSAIKGRFDLTLLPTNVEGKNACTLGGWQLAVSKYSKHPKEAVDFIFYLSGKEEQKRRAIKGSYEPTIQSLYSDADVVKVNPFFAKLYDVFLNAVPRPSTAAAPNYAQVSKIFYSYTHDVLRKQMNGADAVTAMAIDMSEYSK